MPRNEIGSSGGVRPEESGDPGQTPGESRRGDLGAVVSHGAVQGEPPAQCFDQVAQWELGVTVARWLLET